MSLTRWPHLLLGLGLAACQPASDPGKGLQSPDPSSTSTPGSEGGSGLPPSTGPTTSPYEGGWPVGACANDIVATGNAEGDIAEDFELYDQFGEQVHLHDFCDRYVLLISAAFW